APCRFGMAGSRLNAGWLTGGKSGNRRRHVGGIPLAKCRQRRMRQRAVQAGPDPGLVAQILRLAVPPVEPGEGAEQAGISVRRHDGVKLRSEEHSLNSSHLGISYAVFCLKK